MPAYLARSGYVDSDEAQLHRLESAEHDVFWLRQQLQAVGRLLQDHIEGYNIALDRFVRVNKTV